MKTPRIVSAPEWDAALADMLVKEKELDPGPRRCSRPSAGGCPGSRSTRSTASKGPTAA